MDRGFIIDRPIGGTVGGHFVWKMPPGAGFLCPLADRWLRFIDISFILLSTNSNNFISIIYYFWIM